MASFVVLLVALVIATFVGRTPRMHGDWGTKDFIEYWAANQVASMNGNPYDPAQLLPIEQAASRLDDIPLMMWNPPWLLVLMQPVLRMTFPEAASAWIGVNVFMLTLACVLIASGYRRAQFTAVDLVPAVLACLVSVPAVMTIQLGQVSLLLLLVTALLYWALRSGHDITAGVALALLSVKPHLFLLVALLVAIVVLRERRWRILIGAASTTAAFLIATALQGPSLVLQWVHATSSPPIGAPAAITWRTPNLPNLVRELISPWTGSGPSWPLTVIPAIAVLLCGRWLWRRSRMENLDELFPLVLCLSVISAPFGWTFDHVVLAVPQIIIFLRAFGDVERAVRRWTLTGAILLCHLGLVVQAVVTETDYFGFWWFPVAILAVWFLLLRWTGESG